MKAIGFDLGDTLVEYEGVPQNWEMHYPGALSNLAEFLGISLDSRCIDNACGVLRRYNTRINPREKEVVFPEILQEILRCFDLECDAGEIGCASAFFRIFRQRLRCFPDVVPTLGILREMEIKTGVFTDVPYGMPRELVVEDIRETSLTQYLDVLLTSIDCGFRKPSPLTLQLLAREFSCNPSEMAYVGNERKDMEAAKRFGCFSILVDRGGHGKDWGQDRTISSLADLPQVLSSIR